VVADEQDFLDAGLAALMDLEHEIGLLSRLVDDLRLDARLEIAAAAIDIDEARHVGLHDRAPERATALRLDLGLELRVLELLVAFEGDPMDDRILGHGHDQTIAVTANAHVGEQAGGVQRLEGGIEIACFEASVVPGVEIGADRIRLDPPIAFDLDGDLGGLRRRCRLRQRWGKPRRCQQAADEAGPDGADSPTKGVKA
jgi:hypothetical protein